MASLGVFSHPPLGQWNIPHPDLILEVIKLQNIGHPKCTSRVAVGPAAAASGSWARCSLCGKEPPPPPQTQNWASTSITILSKSQPHRGGAQTSPLPWKLKQPMGKHHGSRSGGSPAGGGNGYRSTLLFVIRDKHAVELPFIQMLPPRDVCLVYTAEDSGRFLMIYRSLRSHNSSSDPVAVARVCITSKISFFPPFFCVTQGGRTIRRMKIGLMCLQKMSKQH